MFEVYLTPDGPRILENEQRINILHSLYRGNRTFAAIQNDTGYSKSSVHAALKYLLGDGFLRTDTGSKGEIKYTTSGDLMLVSASVDKDTRMAEQPFMTSSDQYNTLERWVWGHFIYSTHCSGLSMSPILAEVFRNIGEAMAKRDVGIENPGEIVNIIDYLKRSHDAEVSVISAKDREYKIRLYRDATVESCTSFIYAFDSMIVSYLSILDSCSYSIIEYEFLNDAHTEIRFKLGCVDAVLPHGYHRMPFTDKMTCDFVVYWNGKQYIPISNSDHLAILDLLGKVPQSSLSIAEKLGMPQSTVSGYLKTLEKKGIIKLRKLQKNVVYFLFAIAVFKWNPDIKDNWEWGEKCIQRAIEDPGNCSRYTLQYLFYVGMSLGFDVEIFNYYLGRRIGKRIAEDFPDATIEDALGEICRRSHEVFSSSISVVSYSPLTIVKLMDIPVDPVIAELGRDFFDTMICSFMENSTSIPFRVRSSSIYGDDNRGHKATYIPDPRL